MAGKKLLKMGVQAAEEGARKLGQFTLRHPIGARGERDMARPLEEMSHTTEKAERLTPKRVIDPQELADKKALIIGGAFDRSPTAQTLTHINEEKLDRPVAQLGGRDFGRGKEGQGPDKLIGKSGKSVIDKKAKETRIAAERFGEDRPIYFSPIAMGYESGDFNEMSARTIIEMMKTAPMTEKNRLALELVLAAKSPENAMQFPGFKQLWKDQDLTEEWLKTAGVGRTNLARILDMATWQKVGAPDIASARKANIDPKQFDARFGDTGSSLYQADPTGRVVTDPVHKRADYSTGWGGTGAEPLGLTHGVPADIMWPDAVASMKQNMAVKGTDPSKLDMNMIVNGIERGAPVQEANQKWLEGIQRYLESDEGKKYGIDGAIRAGLMTEDQASMFA